TAVASTERAVRVREVPEEAQGASERFGELQIGAQAVQVSKVVRAQALIPRICALVFLKPALRVLRVEDAPQNLGAALAAMLSRQRAPFKECRSSSGEMVGNQRVMLVRAMQKPD